MSVYERLKALNITLPAVEPPAAAFVPVVRSGNLLFVSGHIAKKDGKPWMGKLGDGISTKEGEGAARGIAIELMATPHAAVGNLHKSSPIAKLLVLLNRALTCTEQNLV